VLSNRRLIIRGLGGGFGQYIIDKRSISADSRFRSKSSVDLPLGPFRNSRAHSLSGPVNCVAGNGAMAGDREPAARIAVSQATQSVRVSGNIGIGKTAHSLVCRCPRLVALPFVGNRGVKFRMSRLFNPPDRVTDERRNPNLGQGNYFCSCRNTVYTSRQTWLRQRYSRNPTFDAHYTWGKALAYTGATRAPDSAATSLNNVQDFFNWTPTAGCRRRCHASFRRRLGL
jgi:hypothetical protein